MDLTLPALHPGNNLHGCRFRPLGHRMTVKDPDADGAAPPT